MLHRAGLESQTPLPALPGALLRHQSPRQTARSQGAAKRPRISVDELAFRMLVALRVHPHLGNVLTHVSGADWTRVERSLKAILDSATTSDSLSPLERNMVDLICADRGITGRIMKPYFHAALNRVLERDHAERLIRHLNALFLELEWKAQHPARAATAPSESSSQEPGHA